MEFNSARYEIETTIRLSNRQYAALRVFADLGKRGALSARKALQVDERSLRSLLIRGYVRYDTGGSGFRVTDRGIQRLRDWDGTDIFLQRPKYHFGSTIQQLDSALSGTFKPRGSNKPERVVVMGKHKGSRKRHAA